MEPGEDSAHAPVKQELDDEEMAMQAEMQETSSDLYKECMEDMQGSCLDVSDEEPSDMEAACQAVFPSTQRQLSFGVTSEDGQLELQNREPVMTATLPESSLETESQPPPAAPNPEVPSSQPLFATIDIPSQSQPEPDTQPEHAADPAGQADTIPQHPAEQAAPKFVTIRQLQAMQFPEAKQQHVPKQAATVPARPPNATIPQHPAELATMRQLQLQAMQFPEAKQQHVPKQAASVPAEPPNATIQQQHHAKHAAPELVTIRQLQALHFPEAKQQHVPKQAALVPARPPNATIQQQQPAQHAPPVQAMPPKQQHPAMHAPPVLARPPNSPIQQQHPTMHAAQVPARPPSATTAMPPSIAPRATQQQAVPEQQAMHPPAVPQLQ
ncbi:Ttn, partial [Symbiodinium sp. KB8]